ncbi:Hypothetical predicted protein, partial [Pelobates cultripes]
GPEKVVLSVHLMVWADERHKDERYAKNLIPVPDVAYEYPAVIFSIRNNHHTEICMEQGT